MAPAAASSEGGGEAGRTALIVVDMLNPYEHEDADALARNVEPIVEPIAGLIERSRRAERAALIYVNDNYGLWSPSAAELAERGLAGRRPDLLEPIVPPEDARFVVKARHSIFYATPLEYLLGQLTVDRIVLAGQVTEQCILYSALDAYVRHLQVAVPADAVAHIDRGLGEAAIEMMRRNMRAEIVAAGDCRLD